MKHLLTSILTTSLLAACGGTSDKKADVTPTRDDGNVTPIPTANSSAPNPSTTVAKTFLEQISGNWQSTCYQFESASDKSIWNKKTWNIKTDIVLTQIESFTDSDCKTPKPDSKLAVIQGKAPVLSDLTDGWKKLEFTCDIGCSGLRSSALKIADDGTLLEAGYRASDKSYYTESPIRLISAPNVGIVPPVVAPPPVIPDAPVDSYIAALEGNWSSTCYQFTAGPVWNKKQLSFVNGTLTSSLSTYSDASCSVKTADKTPYVLKNLSVTELAGQEGWKQIEAICASGCNGSYKVALKSSGEGLTRQLQEAGFNKKDGSFYIASPILYSIAP